jgi:hypothetical protein
MGLSDAPVQNPKDQEFCEGLIELRGMQWDPEWNANQLVGNRIGERHGPWEMALDTPAAARRETAEPADAVSQGDAGRENVRRAQDRQPAPPHIPDSHRQRGDQSAIEDSARLQGRQR